MIKKFSALLLFLFAFTACSPNQVESTYVTYQDAVDDEFFDHGWIPDEAVSQSMVNIFCRSDVAANTCIFGFQTSIEDIEILRTKMQFTDEFVQLPATIKQPQWWIDILSNSQNYVLQSSDQVVFIAIQNDGNTVLGWRN